MRSVWLCVVVLLSLQALLVVSASTSHDDRAVPKKHVLTKRHLQPILDTINSLLGTGPSTTTPAPDTLTSEAVAPEIVSPVVVPPAGVVPAVVPAVNPPIAVVPAVIVPATEGPTTESPIEGSTTESPIEGSTTEASTSESPTTISADVTPFNNASPSEKALKVSKRSVEGLNRSKRSFEPLLTVGNFATLPHHKLEEVLRSLPGGKYVVEDHYNASAPKPLQEQYELLLSAFNVMKKDFSFNKKIEIVSPAKTVTKTVSVEKNIAPGLIDRLNRLLGLGKTPPPTTLPPVIIEPTTLPPVAVVAPVAPPVAVVPVVAPPVQVVPAIPPVPVAPVAVVPTAVIATTEPPPPPPVSDVTTTAAPLLEASISKVVKITANDPSPVSTTPLPEATAAPPVIVAPATVPPVAVVAPVAPPVAVVPAVVPPVEVVPAVVPPAAVVPAVALTTTPPPLLEASVSKVVKITANDPSSVSTTPPPEATTAPPVIVAPAAVPPVAVVAPVAPPAAVVPAVVPPVEVVPAVVPPAAVVAADALTTTPPPLLEASVSKTVKIPANDANPDSALPAKDALKRFRRSLQASRRLKRSLGEKMVAFNVMLHWPHKKLEELLRSLPGGKFVVQNHYNTSLPTPHEELKALLLPLLGLKKNILITKTVEIKTPLKTISKTFSKGIGGPLVIPTTVPPSDITTPDPLVITTKASPVGEK